jgi:excisionase family DNA binding protein
MSSQAGQRYNKGGSMEKICLVKLRKKIINPLLSQGEQGIASQGKKQWIPQQFIASYAKNDIINNGVSNDSGKEREIPHQFISSFTRDDVINNTTSDNEGIELGGARQFIAPCADNDIVPHRTAEVITLADNKKTVPGETVSLTLTQEQIKTIRSSSSLLSVFNGELTGGSAELNYRDEPVTIKFEFEPLVPIRLLMSEEVVQMLRISNGFLKTIVREGKLKSYKIGKRRRYMLEDVLSYLQASLNPHDAPQDTLRAETI